MVVYIANFLIDIYFKNQLQIVVVDILTITERQGKIKQIN